MARRILFWNVIRKQWLLVGIVICIIFACIYPKLGSKEGTYNHTGISRYEKLIL